jgi:ribosomal protein S18 acetylase RimI-like enzyme
MRYRTATMADKEQLQNLGIKAFGQYKKVLTEENWHKLYAIQTAPDTYPNLLKKSTCFVCEAAGEIVGMAYLILSGNPTDVFQENWCYLRMVGVHPEHGGKGIGKTLTLRCIEHAKEKNEHTMALHTSEFMDAARHIYEQIGFKQIRALEPGFGKKYWLYMLEL